MLLTLLLPPTRAEMLLVVLLLLGITLVGELDRALILIKDLDGYSFLIFDLI